MIPFQLYHYDYESEIKGEVLDERFEDRLHWNGSKSTTDLQDGSIYILNVSLNDSGTYRCRFNRVLKYPNEYEYQTNTTKDVHIIVVRQRKDILFNQIYDCTERLIYVRH